MKIAFLGHRKIENREIIRSITTAVIAKLIAQGSDTFLFGSRSEFDSLCHEIVSEFKRNNPQLKRVYVRAEYEFISDDYTAFLLERFESTFFPKEVSNAGKAAYIKRNQVMIDLCDLAVIYYDKNYSPAKTHSGTARAVEYLLQKKKQYINIKSQLNFIGIP